MKSGNLKIRLASVGLLILATFLAACGDASPTSVTTTTVASTTTAATTAVATTSVPTATLAPIKTNTATAAPATTTIAQTTTTSAAATTATAPEKTLTLDTGKDLFIDDRSGPLQVLQSFYNAINRKEYVRAYSYWTIVGEATQTKPLPYAQFEQGYAGTASVQITVGPYSGGAAAGTSYTSVPVIIKSTQTGGANKVFTGCYTLRFPNPGNYGAPSIQPLVIDKAEIKEMSGDTGLPPKLSALCTDVNLNNLVNPAVPANPNGIGPNVYIDSRSTPEDVLRSYYNAINSKQYVRAYSYWEQTGTSATSQPPAYPQFEKGYADTKSVQLEFGKSSGQGAAGSIYTNVPVLITATLNNGNLQVFGGCYVVRQVQPAFFGAPPFHSMSIYSAKVQDFSARSEDSTTLLSRACSNQ